MVFVTGDCHADFRRFSTDIFPEQKEMTYDDTVIILGDFGGIWSDSKDERYWLEWLNSKPFTTVFVDGNHENFDRLYSGEFPVVEFHGGKAHKIRDHIYHLMRGYVFEFDGKKFFAFGGASSHDIQDGILDEKDYPSKAMFRRAVKLYRERGKFFRVNHVSWWQQELPSREELDFGLETLKQNGHKVDFIVSHCCPQSVAAIMGFFKGDVLTGYFDEIARTVEFDKWYFGHYHDERTILCKFNLLYFRIERIV